MLIYNKVWKSRNLQAIVFEFYLGGVAIWTGLSRVKRLMVCQVHSEVNPVVSRRDELNIINL